MIVFSTILELRRSNSYGRVFHGQISQDENTNCEVLFFNKNCGVLFLLIVVLFSAYYFVIVGLVVIFACRELNVIKFCFGIFSFCITSKAQGVFSSSQCWFCVSFDLFLTPNWQLDDAHVHRHEFNTNAMCNTAGLKCHWVSLNVAIEFLHD